MMEGCCVCVTLTMKTMLLFGSVLLAIADIAAGLKKHEKNEEKSGKNLKNKEKSRVNKVNNSGVTLYSESKYNWDYLNDYKKMVSSLLQSVGNPVSFLINKEMIRSGSELSTASEFYGRFSNEIAECSNSFKGNLKTIKVLQDEESNYVMLKEDVRSKKMYVEKSTRSESSFTSEVEFFSKMDTSNQLFPTFVCHMRTPGRENRNSVVTEFIRGRDSHLLAAVATSEQLKGMVKQLFEAVVDLHRMGFIHADIKPGNVLVTDNFEVKLIDFGMATRVGRAKKYRGSPYTRAPELHEMCPGEVDLGIDWWAFGSTVAIWYYYHYNAQHLKSHQQVHQPADYLQIFSSYDFTPFKWNGRARGFQPGMFPSNFEESLRKFLALFLTIDPELRAFDSVRLHNIIRNHEFFTTKINQP